MEAGDAVGAGLGVLGVIIWLVMFVISIGSLVCMIMVWVKMFQAGQTGLGVAMILLTIFCGIGGLITFIIGWMRSSEWQLKKVMVWWTILMVLGIVLSFVFGATIFGAIMMQMDQQMQMEGFDPNEMPEFDFGDEFPVLPEQPDNQ